MPTPVAVLGATGTVGQKLLRMLWQHPEFQVTEVVASERNQHRPYAEAVQWREDIPLPAPLASLTLCSPSDIRSPFALSALPSAVARDIEFGLAQRGVHVVSNASALRMEDNVPLLIPEINCEHLSLIREQNTPGKIVTNPNCATVFAALALAPLRELGELEHVSLATLQAISGAGYPGVSALDITGNTIPNIAGEEEKITQESKKILSTPHAPAAFSVTVHVHRIPVLHGHTIVLHLLFKTPVSPKEVTARYQQWNHRHPQLFHLHQDPFHPQPAKDLHPLDQSVHIGRIKQGDHPHIIGLIAQGHNLVRGAAGAALLNLQALQEYLSS